MRRSIVLVVFLLAFQSGIAQIQVNVLKIYEDIARKGYTLEETLERVGDAYYFQKDYKQAYSWYDKLMSNRTYKPKAAYYYRYSEVLQALGRKAEADKALKTFASMVSAQDKASEGKSATKVSGTVKDLQTGEPLSGVALTLLDRRMNVIGTTTTDVKGAYSFDKPVENSAYVYIRGVKKGYEGQEPQVFFTKGDALQYELLLPPNTYKVEEYDDLARLFAIDNIHFNYGSINIRYDASVQLAKVVALMEAHPSVRIDVKVHTDSRADESYAMEQTESQAGAIYKWLLSKGVPSSRLTAKGYGGTQLVNGCEKGVPCSEEEHQANKRVEFIVTSL